MSNCQRQRSSIICGYNNDERRNYYKHINKKITNYEKDNSVDNLSHCVSDSDSDGSMSNDVVNLSGAKISSMNIKNTVEAGYFGHPGKFTAPIGWKPASRSIIKRKKQKLADIANSL